MYFGSRTTNSICTCACGKPFPKNDPIAKLDKWGQENVKNENVIFESSLFKNIKNKISYYIQQFQLSLEVSTIILISNTHLKNEMIFDAKINKAGFCYQ